MYGNIIYVRGMTVERRGDLLTSSTNYIQMYFWIFLYKIWIVIRALLYTESDQNLYS